MIKITLNQIRAHDPCADGWAKVLKAQGGTGADFDSPFPASSILDSNGLDDTWWVLRCLPEYGSLWRLCAVWCARQVQHLMTDPKSIDALDVAERHAKGLATDQELRDAARGAIAAMAAARAAGYAVRYAEGDAAWAAARAAGDAARGGAIAAMAAAWAAREAAGDAAGASREAMREKQAAKLRQILDAGEWVDGGGV